MNWKIVSVAMALALTTGTASFAQGRNQRDCPPPQKMPFDFGISAVLGAGAVAAYKARKRKQEIAD